MDINRPGASLYIIWKGFHWCTSVSSSGTLSSCVYMISNIWMKTEKIINLDWKQNRSTNLSVLAFRILNAEPIPVPQEWDNGAQEGPAGWPRGKWPPWQADFLRKELHCANRGWEGMESKTTGNMKNTNLKEPGCWNQELWSLTAMISLRLQTQCVLAWGQGCAGNSSS